MNNQKNLLSYIFLYWIEEQKRLTIIIIIIND